MRSHSTSAALALLSAAAVSAQDKANSWEIFHDAGVSAQMLFLGTAKTAYIVDKTENNPAKVTGANGQEHPAWAASLSLDKGTSRPMDIVTNSFCAGGTVLGDGRWINAGGNQAITTGGATPDANTPNVYGDESGGAAVRILTPCDDDSCEWSDDKANAMTSQRWYPQLETLPDGTAFILGGDLYGGFVNNVDGSQNNPTWELFPRNGAAQVPIQFLNDSLPANLYPLTWLTPDNNLFIQAGWMTTLYDWKTRTETRLPNVTHAVRTYPASGATAMLPQTKANNWTAPVLFCGGSDIADNLWTDWGNRPDLFRAHENSKSCVHITPAPDAQWEDNDDLPEARSMGQFVTLPDGRLFLLNGIASGVAGYDAAGIPYGTDPIYEAAYFDPSAAKGKRWSRKGVQKANLPRLYHSTAILNSDGSVIVAGSNPYADFQTNGSMINAGANSSKTEAEWWSETRVELFYPDYYDKPRPKSLDDIKSVSYGGDIMTVDLSSDDIKNVKNVNNVKVVLSRPGFSTHAMNMGMRHVELETSLVKTDNGATLNIAPLPANAAVLAPGPVLLFLVVNGVPSQGTMIMAGNGKLGDQPLGEYPTLPESSGFDTKATSGGSSSSGSDSGSDSGALQSSIVSSLLLVVAGLAVFLA